MTSIESNQTNQTPGQRLAARRQELGISLADAARTTRIRRDALVSLEADNLAHFPHPSYARFFLMDYCRFLGLPLTEVQEWLPVSGQCTVEGYSYLQNLSGEGTGQRWQRSAAAMAERPAATASAHGLFRLIALVVVLAIAGTGYFLHTNLDRLVAAAAEVSPVADALAAPLPEPEETPVKVVTILLPSLENQPSLDLAVREDSEYLNTEAIMELRQEPVADEAAPLPLSSFEIVGEELEAEPPVVVIYADAPAEEEILGDVAEVDVVEPAAGAEMGEPTVRPALPLQAGINHLDPLTPGRTETSPETRITRQ